MSAFVCRILGHRLRFAEFDPITITHALHCDRCGLHGWPGLSPPVSQGADVSGIELGEAVTLPQCSECGERHPFMGTCQACGKEHCHCWDHDE